MTSNSNISSIPLTNKIFPIERATPSHEFDKSSLSVPSTSFSSSIFPTTKATPKYN